MLYHNAPVVVAWGYVVPTCTVKGCHPLEPESLAFKDWWVVSHQSCPSCGSVGAVVLALFSNNFIKSSAIVSP